MRINGSTKQGTRIPKRKTLPSDYFISRMDLLQRDVLRKVGGMRNVDQLLQAVRTLQNLDLNKLALILEVIKEYTVECLDV